MQPTEKELLHLGSEKSHRTLQFLKFRVPGTRVIGLLGGVLTGVLSSGFNNGGGRVIDESTKTLRTKLKKKS